MAPGRSPPNGLGPLASPVETTTIAAGDGRDLCVEMDVVFLGLALAGRRLVPVAVMLAGALIGAALIRHAQACDPLIIALAAVVTGSAASRQLGRTDPAWVHTQR